MTFADRGRFPMLKDIYSAGLGAGLPNPNLLPEHAFNWNAGYLQLIGAKTIAQLVLVPEQSSRCHRIGIRDRSRRNKSSATAFCPNSKIIGFCSEMANIGKEMHEGIEFEVRSTPLPRLTLNASYSFLNRDINYDFVVASQRKRGEYQHHYSADIAEEQGNRNVSYRFPHQILAILNERYESGLTLQDTTYATTSPLFLPYSEAYATTDIFAVVPIRAGITLQAGVKNLLDRNYYYTAGSPEEGRNWFFNLRYHF